MCPLPWVPPRIVGHALCQPHSVILPAAPPPATPSLRIPRVMSCGKKMWGRRYKTFHHSLKTFHGSPFAPRVGRIRPALILFPSLVSQRSAGCPSGQRERSVKPSALPTLVQIQHLPLPRIGWIRGLNFFTTRYPLRDDGSGPRRHPGSDRTRRPRIRVAAPSVRIGCSRPRSSR